MFFFTEDSFHMADLTQRAAFDGVVEFMRQNIIFQRIDKIFETDAFFQQWYDRNPEFRDKYPDRARELDTLLVESRWIALIGLTAEKTLDLFHNHLGELFNLQDRYGIPRPDQNIVKEYVTEKLRARLLAINTFDERDEFKKQLVEAIVSNEEEITSQVFYRGIKEARPTTKLWFAEYIEFLPNETVIKIKQQEFFAKNENYKRLDEVEKERIQLLIQEYEQLRISSWKESGIEETVRYEDEKGTGVVQYGQVEYDDPELAKSYDEFFSMKQVQDLMKETKFFADEEYGLLQKRPPITEATRGALPDPTLGKGPNIAATAGPDHFTAKDEAEIQQLRAAGGAPQERSAVQYQAQAQQLIKSLKLNFVTPEQQKKFTMLLESVLRGLRDHMELSGYLEDMLYSPEEIETILRTVKQAVKQAIRGKTQSTMATGKAASSATVGPDRLAVSQSQKMSQKRSALETADIFTDLPTMAQPTGIAAPSTLTATPSALAGKKSFLPKLRRSRRTKRPLIDDVKISQSMVMGPIDELRAMDLVEFRRLSPDPMVAAGKLRDKIELLGQEAISKQADGVQAFRESALNQMYIEIGNASIGSGKTVADVIAERAAQGQITLSLNEFNAVSDLNKELRF